MYSVFCLKHSPTTTHEPPHAQNNRTNGNIEFLQPYPTAAADTLLEIGMAIISAVLSLNEHFLCPKILLPVSVVLPYLVFPCQDTYC
jgi:hypothetical protein